MTCIDLGTFTSKIGTSEQQAPIFVPSYAVQALPAEFQSAEVKPQTPFANISTSLFVNDEIHDFEQLERILTIAASPELQKEFEERPEFSEQLYAAKNHNFIDVAQAPIVDLTISLPHASKSKQQLCEILFNYYSTEKVKFAEQTACQLFSTGRVTGTVLNLGYSQNQAVCYNDGYWVSQSARVAQAAGGRRAGIEIAEFLAYNGVYALGDGFYQAFYADYIKNFAFGGYKLTFTLPDQQTVDVDEAAFAASQDCYFNPNTEIAECSCVKMLENVQACAPEEIKESVLQNTVVSGGMARISGLISQLMGEIKYCITESPEIDCFVGLQVISHLEGGFIDKKTWEEQGEALWSVKK